MVRRRKNHPRTEKLLKRSLQRPKRRLLKTKLKNLRRRQKKSMLTKVLRN